MFLLLSEKTELFLELFGNSLVRPQTNEYLQQKSNKFIRYLLKLVNNLLGQFPVTACAFVYPMKYSIPLIKRCIMSILFH